MTQVSIEEIRAAHEAGIPTAFGFSAGEVVGPFPSLNTSGFEPLDLRVLVLPDEVSTKHGSVYLPESVVEQDKFAQTKATMIAVGENAWEEAKARAPNFVPPRPGDRILYGKYSGQRLKGDDGKDYVILNDEDVLARLSKEA